jgi:hypothetical protein
LGARRILNGVSEGGGKEDFEGGEGSRKAQKFLESLPVSTKEWSGFSASRT